MNYAEMLLPEFDEEMANTRKVLERLPENKLSWRPHEKSNTIGWNANHLAEIPGWVEGTMRGDSWDFAPPGETPYQTPNLMTRDAILASFDANVAAARQAIQAGSDADFAQPWSLFDGGKLVFTMPRAAVLRLFLMNHSIHHRAILTVYYRLNDIPVPGLYGPSADENS